MENAKRIWEELKLPELTPRVPGHGYELGYWPDSWNHAAQRAVAGEYLKTGEDYLTCPRGRRRRSKRGMGLTRDSFGALAGATILPPVPAFYHQPKSIDDLLAQTAGKILNKFAIEHTLFRRWDGTTPPSTTTRPPSVPDTRCPRRSPPCWTACLLTGAGRPSSHRPPPTTRVARPRPRPPPASGGPATGAWSACSPPGTPQATSHYARGALLLVAAARQAYSVRLRAALSEEVGDRRAAVVFDVTAVERAASTRRGGQQPLARGDGLPVSK